MRFTRAIVRPPGANFADGLTTVDLGRPDYSSALRQHAAYCLALEQCGVELIRLEPDLRFPDSTFVEDTAILTERVAVITRPGDPSRQGEETEIEVRLRAFYKQGELIEAPGTVDGGDICEAGPHFFIGVSKRTNEEGARQLGAILARFGYTSSVIDVRSVAGILHLKSGLSWLGGKQLIAIEALAGHASLSAYEILRVDASEEYAANCIRVNGVVFLAAGFPKTRAMLKAAGHTLVELDMSEFEKMDGGLSCLSLRF